MDSHGDTCRPGAYGTESETLRNRKRHEEEKEIPGKVISANDGAGEDAPGVCKDEKKENQDEDNEIEEVEFGPMQYRRAKVIYSSNNTDGLLEYLNLQVECGALEEAENGAEVENSVMPLKVTCKPKIVGQASVTVEGGASVSMDHTGILEMIDTFDRPGSASAVGTFAGAGTFAYGCENKPGRRIPRAGVYAAAGVGRAKAEYSIFEVEAKGPNASAGAGASVGSLSAGAFARAEVASASYTAGPLKASVGLAVDTGVGVGVTGVEFKVLGTGFSFGRKMSFSLFGTGVEFTFW